MQETSLYVPDYYQIGNWQYIRYTYLQKLNFFVLAIQ